MQEWWKRANRAMERILFPLKNGKPKDLQLKDYCHELC
jgi:hypothetical protein